MNAMFILISLETEIARSARGLKLQRPRAGDAMMEPYLVLKIFGDLKTCEICNVMFKWVCVSFLKRT